jgi:hypothetical protein
MWNFFTQKEDDTEIVTVYYLVTGYYTHLKKMTFHSQAY